MRLTQLFESLPLPISDRSLPSFSALPVPGVGHRLGKDDQGCPALLVAVDVGARNARPAPIELEHIAVQHDVRCILWHSEEQQEQASFTVIRCRRADRILTEYFLRVVEGVLPLLGPDPSEARAREVIDILVELFRNLTMPPRKSIQGLWAELFLIAVAGDSSALARAWHVSPGEAFDFCAAGQRIEVKSVAGEERRHYFRLEQVHPPAGTKVLIASLRVERAGGGVSLGDLVERARARVAGQADLVVRIDQVVAASLGQGWRQALDERFDWERAHDSLLYFDSTSIPAVTPPVPPGVSEVRFRSDLTGSPGIEAATLRRAGGLFQAALPLRRRAWDA